MENHTIYRYFSTSKNVHIIDPKSVSVTLPKKSKSLKLKKPQNSLKEEPTTPVKADSENRQVIKYSPQVRKRPKKFFRPHDVPPELQTAREMKKAGLVSNSPKKGKLTPQKNSITSYFSPTKMSSPIKTELKNDVGVASLSSAIEISSDEEPLPVDRVKKSHSDADIATSIAPSKNDSSRTVRRALSLKKFNKKPNRSTKPGETNDLNGATKRNTLGKVVEEAVQVPLVSTLLTSQQGLAPLNAGRSPSPGCEKTLKLGHDTASTKPPDLGNEVERVSLPNQDNHSISYNIVALSKVGIIVEKPHLSTFSLNSVNTPGNSLEPITCMDLKMPATVHKVAPSDLSTNTQLAQLPSPNSTVKWEEMSIQQNLPVSINHSSILFSDPLQKQDSLCDIESLFNPQNPSENILKEPDKENVIESIDWEDFVDHELTQPLQKRSPVKPKPSPLLPIIKVPDIILNENITEGIINFLICSPSSQLAWATFLKEKDYLDVATSFCSLGSLEKRLYARLFSRKNSWIKLSNIDYSFLNNEDKVTALKALQEANFVTDDYSNEDMAVLLNLMSLDEVRQLCKLQNIDSKGNKGDMIKRIKHSILSQNTIFSSKMSLERLTRSRISELLGYCVKLCEGPRKLFDMLLLIATYPYFYGEEKERLNDLNRRLNMLKWGSTSYPRFKYKPCPVFHLFAHFKEYYVAVQLTSELLAASEKKDWTLAATLALKVKERLEPILKNSSTLSWIKSLPGYLVKFTGANKLTYALTKGINILKKDPKNSEEVISSLNLLLSQRQFRKKSRGYWYNELALIYQTRLKDISQAASVVLEGLKDPDVTHIWRLDLSSRASLLMKRKKNGLTNEHKCALQEVIVLPQFIPQTVHIQARSAPNVTVGRKQIFVREITDGKEYSSVEELVIEHYKHNLGFQNGKHDEGKMILNLAICLLWDIIYCEPESLPENESLFHSPMQTVPLDWGGRPFYHLRKNKIEELFAQMKVGGVNAIFEKLQNTANEWKNTEGAVDWIHISLEPTTILPFLECIKVDVFLSIADHLISNYTAFRSGFPDLTLWDPPTSRFALVEVKGPSDTLSTKQILWLENLMKFGADAHVCRVNTLNTGKRKLTEEAPQPSNS